SSRNRSVLRYFLFESLNTVATTASPPRSSCASSAARKFAPLEMPTPSPSSVASFCAMRIASPSSTAITRSSSSRCTIGGMNSSLTPWMRCLPTLWPVESVGEFDGSIGWRRIAGFRLRRKRPAPMIVPPVPTPATNAAGTRFSDRSCAQSSGPVVRKCASLLASLLNWRGRNEPGVSAASSSARLIDPTKPPSAGETRRTLAPNDRISAMRSALIQSGMKIVTGCPSARPIAQNEIPVLPLVASMIIPPACRTPDSRAWRTMCSAILSLMLSVMLRFSAFAYKRRVRPSSIEKSIASNGVLPTRTRRPRNRSASENLFMAVSWLVSSGLYMMMLTYILVALVALAVGVSLTWLNLRSQNQNASIREGLERMGEQLAALEKERASSHASLHEHLRLMGEGQKNLTDETETLVRALRAPQVRGQWGEMQLRRVVELAGMLEHCDFVEQATVSTEDGRLRPDLIVHLPGHKAVVVDSKAPLQAYLDAAEETDEAKRGAFLDQHAP